MYMCIQYTMMCVCVSVCACVLASYLSIQQSTQITSPIAYLSLVKNQPIPKAAKRLPLAVLILVHYTGLKHQAAKWLWMYFTAYCEDSVTLFVISCKWTQNYSVTHRCASSCHYPPCQHHRYVTVKSERGGGTGMRGGGDIIIQDCSTSQYYYY